MYSCTRVEEEDTAAPAAHNPEKKTMLARGRTSWRVLARSLTTGPAPALSDKSVVTAAQAPTSSPRTAYVVMAVAAAIPIGYAAYNWKDPRFQSSLRSLTGRPSPASPTSASAAPAATAALSKPANNAPATSSPSQAAAKPAAAAAEDWPAIKKELDQLEARLRAAEPRHSEQFNKAEVDSVRAHIARVEAQAQPPPPPPSSNTTSTAEMVQRVAEEELPVASTPDATAAPPPPPPAVDRSSVDTLRAQARQVAEEATAKARAEVEKAEASLRVDLETVLATDLGRLDEQGLRQRLVQLVLELKDRNKWEALRLHEFVTRNNEDMAARYLGMLREQERLYEDVVRQEAARAAHEAATAAEERMRALQQGQLARQREALQLIAQKDVAQAREEERKKADEERQSRIAVLHDLQARLGDVNQALFALERARAEAVQHHRAALAALRLTRAVLVDGDNVESLVSELRAESAGDAVITDALLALPPRVYGAGVNSMRLLNKRFEEAKTECRERASAASEATGVVQHALAKVSGNLTIGPRAAGLDAALQQAGEELDRGNLARAVEIVDGLPANVKEGAQDWLSLARDRLELEAALRVVTLRLEQMD